MAQTEGSQHIPTPGLTVLQRTAASLLARGRNRQQVAVALGVSVGTLSKWRRLPAFQEAEAEAAETARTTTVRGIIMDAMLSARRDDGVDWTARLRAAAMLDQLDEREAAGTPAAQGGVLVFPDALEAVLGA